MARILGEILAELAAGMSARQFAESEPELMDRPDASPAELEAALRSLRGLNRYFGGSHIVSHFIRRWIRRGDHVRVLDLATGSADLPRLVADHARKVGATAEIVAVDFKPETLPIARPLDAHTPEDACQGAALPSFQLRQQLSLRAHCSALLHIRQ